MKSYEYVSIGGKYFCTQQSVFRLMLFAALHRKACPSFVNAPSLLRLFLHRSGTKRYAASFELPMRGAWCLRVNNGYKLFDPYARVVTKIYDDTTDKDLIAKELKHQSMIGEHSFAPRLIKSSEKEAWYQEEMMMGKTGMYFSPETTRDFMRIYSSEIAPTLADLATLHPETRVKISTYIEHMPDSIQSEIDRITDQDAQTGHLVQNFFDDALTSLQEISNEEVSLVFAHGDFHLYNLFTTNKGVMLTDWEGIGQQSLLFDLFTFFFSHLWTGKSEDNLIESIEEGIRELANRVESQNKAMALEIIENADKYLKLYYVERLYGYATTFRQTPESLRQWVQVYIEYEENAARN